ncbi:MAG: tRNA pseudouridine(13) synthase TruD [Gemmataceae bacterium]|nr:tRNA pseudouridine(13) synthase TruD [Gemmataceae bacterium]MDW8264990.1 tRNA pseudouridine(13) synthase TruD [Gemmataceae bacterium]
MAFDPLALPPLWTADLPGIGGRLKQEPEDFEVEEIPAYEPSGQGGYLYLWVEKRGLGSEFFIRQLAQRLRLGATEVGLAGLKDRQAVTRQWVSVPATAESRLAQLDGDGIRVLAVSRHGNKLRTGHLRGNRFRILVRDVGPAATPRADAIIQRLRQLGLPNFYGPQRFGQGGATVERGLAILRGERPAGKERPFLRKLALSAAQASLFNHYLSRRLRDGLLRQLLDGDVAAQGPVGGLFLVDDVPREQARFEAREIVSAGPMFGRKTFPAAREAARREAEVLADAGLTPASLTGHGRLLPGTRRHNLVYVDDLVASEELEGLRLCFTLPAGSYATVLLRELMKNAEADRELSGTEKNEGISCMAAELG